MHEIYSRVAERRTSDYQWQSGNSSKFNSSIFLQNGIGGAADEAVLNNFLDAMANILKICQKKNEKYDTVL